jgi:hypothetical protein
MTSFLNNMWVLLFWKSMGLHHGSKTKPKQVIDDYTRATIMVQAEVGM